MLDEIETWGLDRLAAHESVLLRKQLSHVVAGSAFYRHKLAAAGVDPASISTVADLRKVPFTEKEELRRSLSERPPLGSHLAVPVTDLAQIQATSGTSGTPSYFGLTEHDLVVWGTAGARGFYAAGVRPGDLVLHGWGMSKGFAGGVPAVRVLQQLGCVVIPIGGEAGAERLLTVAASLRPKVFCTGPNFALHAGHIADEVLGRPASSLGVERLVVGGEPGGGVPAIRSQIEQVWNATSCETLGNSDVVPIVFAECLERDGMHFVGQGLVHIELIDPRTEEGIDFETGASGELVLTALDRLASPLVRFRTRDHLEVLSTSCPCGRTGPRVRCVGRTDDMMIVRGINVWPSAVREVAVTFQPRLTGNLRIVADFDGHSTEQRLRVRVEHRAGLSVDEVVAVESELERRITQVLAFRPRLEMVPPGVIPEAGVNKTGLVERT
ncbi:phenylacetate-CoA ligase [Nocardioides marinisabuli]|uniref:Phenylacetate-CoA ligase n=1 Tax=Nocardioides marinisabuli TaxID=419476 RepID=A0A7Y9JPL7_9ACTN|nr:phenylacetate--CoA ligase family protein [Nocardioides marinisabuli]NYD57172.1 phenylacetate-CoA ligase [Nocardioides marinisabuli]